MRLLTDNPIDLFIDRTRQLLKALVSVSKPADLGVALPSCGSQIEGNRNEGDDVYPGLGPLNGGKTLCPALVYIDEDVSSHS